jgi:3-methyl-2-oxobutanoate hydroxymethyltransferase
MSLGNSPTTPYETLNASAGRPIRKQLNLPELLAMHARGEKIAMLTAYDATFGALADAAGVHSLLVGDSLGMVSQGLPNTLGVSLETICYHVESVHKGLQRVQGAAWLIGDLPFGSYQESREQALRSAVELLKAGANMVKLEGGGWTAEVVAFLVERGIPVCAHLGLTPQTIHALGGYRVQGRGDKGGIVRQQANALAQAGASMLVLEMVPTDLAKLITQDLKTCPTIGIGAGNATSGQVLVMHDMLGANMNRAPKFVRNFLAETSGIQQAFEAYVAAVQSGQFPNNELHAW